MTGYTLITSYAVDDATVTVANRTLPVPALVEDEHGIRMLLLAWPGRVSMRTYTEACRDGAAAVVCVDTADMPGSMPFAAMTVEQFMDERTENRETVSTEVLDPFAWQDYFEPPTYTDIVRRGSRAKEPVEDQPTGSFVHIHTHSEYCLAPETLVVTADLQWKRIDQVVVGEQLVGFDEDLRPPEGERGNSRSKMRRATVTGIKTVVRDCYRITLEDGTTIVASGDHGWVVAGTTRGSMLYPGGPQGGYGTNTRRWIKTKDLLVGKNTWQNRSVAHPRLVLWAKPWGEVPDDLVREAAYLAGIADGEGWLSGGQFSLGQNPGPVLDEMHRVCKALGYETTAERVQGSRGDCRTFRMQGYETVLRFLAQCRPVRFQGRTDEVWVGRRAGSRHTRPVQVVAVEHLGDRETIAVQTDTGTFVAEGFLSHNSALDGLSTVKEMVSAAVADGHPALVFTDHGNCAVHPEAQKVCDEAGIKACFGMEAYFVPDRHRRRKEWEEKDESGNVVKKNDSQEALQEYNHLILIAMNDVGLTNLWSASTEAYLTGFYGTPRLDWDTLERLNEGLIASTGCLRGPVCRPYLNDDEARARMNLGRLYDIFGDRLYVEIHANHLDEQIKVNQFLVQVAREMSIPIVAAVDSHYPTCEDKQTHQYWLRMTTNKEIDEDTSLFAGGQDYHLMTTDEVRKALDYLPDDVVEEAISNTVRLAARCEARVQGEIHTPVFSKGVDNPRQVDIERLVDLCASNWDRKVKGKDYPESEALARFEREMGLIILGQFPGYFLTVADYVRHAKKTMLVGPSRGSGGGSLVAYLADITEVDPIENGLLFERFLNEGRLDSLPDFDIDFPASQRGDQKGYLIERWGAEHVATIGTISRMAAKLAINQAARIFADQVHWPDIEKVKAEITAVEKGLAGKHVDWEKFWAEMPDDSEVAEIRRKYPQVFDLADRVVGRIKTYGTHAAGVVISTGEPLTRLPLRVKEGQVITQFDMGALESLGYVKFDILTLRTLDTIQVCIDLVKEKLGIDINVYDWREEYRDLQVWEALSDGDTLGVFQVETSSGTRLIKRFRPMSLHDLAAVMTIVRPGPAKSGLTETYLRRRDGLEPVTYPHPKLEPVLKDTYGCMIYQEQIMEICSLLAGYTLVEADEVRSILGKKKVEKVTAAGEKFVQRCVAHGTDESIALSLWSQMAEFAKYSFNKAHAFGYAVLGYWTAWFKFHFPAQFLTAALTTIDDDRIPEFIAEAQRLGYVIRPPDINLSKVGFSCTETEILYGFQGVHGIGPSAAPAIVAGQPYESVEDFLVRRDTQNVDLGVCKLLAQVGAFDSLHPSRRAVEQRIESVVDKSDQRCKWWNDRVIKEHGLPCTFDWDSEPREKGKGGKLLKAKPPPKKCTKGCRHYEQGEVVMLDLAPYTKREIREREAQLLGIHLSSTPFDEIPEEDRRLCRKASELRSLPGEDQVVAAIVKRVKEHTASNGQRMAFLTLFAQDGDIEAVAFNKAWAKYRDVLKKDDLIIGCVYQGDRGWVLSHAVAASLPAKVS